MTRIERVRNVIGWIIIISLIGTCAGIAIWDTGDINSQQPNTTISCFVGHIMARDTSTTAPTFMIKAVGPPEVHHDSVQVPTAPMALVCARFPADGTSTRPSSSALRLSR